MLNKYYPPDFDPAKLPRMKLTKDRQYKVRLMAPFHMRCKNCGNYIYKGTKFNAVKVRANVASRRCFAFHRRPAAARVKHAAAACPQETALGETYLGMYIFRFYIRCPVCCTEITFKVGGAPHAVSRHFARSLIPPVCRPTRRTPTTCVKPAPRAILRNGA